MAAPCRGFLGTRPGALLLQLPSQGFSATSRRKQLRPSFPLTTHARYPAISHPLQTKRLLDSVCCHGTENRCLHLTTPKHWPDPSKGQRGSQSLTSDAVQHLVLLILLRAAAAFLGAAGPSQKDIKQRQDLSGAEDLPQGLTVTDDAMAKLDGYQKTQPELLGCWTIVQFKYCRNFCIFLVFACTVK